jgi:hypothetical protein
MNNERPHDRLFEALQSLGDGWHSRSEIAKKLSKPRLTAYDAALIDVLVSEGRIEAEQQDSRGPIGYQWRYRIAAK